MESLVQNFWHLMKIKPENCLHSELTRRASLALIDEAKGYAGLAEPQELNPPTLEKTK